MQQRRGSVRAKVQQLDWVMMFVTHTTTCPMCSLFLKEGYDPRYPGRSITIHHTEGSREEDRWDDRGYVSKMILCHSSCHKRYHLLKRHKDEGKNITPENNQWLIEADNLISKRLSEQQ